MPKKTARKPAAKPRKRPAKAAKPRRRAAAPPKPARARKAPQRAARAPKVPARFRALGGVDPRTLPPGTPYPCTDGYVGAVVRGDKLAGRIVACATPPVGSRGQHYVLGKVASGRAISAEFRKGYKVAEKVAAVQRERARRDSIRTPEAAGPSFAPRVKQASVERRSQRVEVAAQPVPARIFRMELLGDAAEALYYTRPFLVLADGTRFAIDFYHHRDGHGEPLLACGPGLISEKAYDTVKVMPLLGEDVARELAAALAGIGVSVRLVDVTGDYAVFATTAPDAYDGMGTVAIKHGFTPADIDDWSRQRYQWRAILVPRRSVEWQTMRNSSGNHPSWPSSLGEVSGLVPVAPKVTAPTAEPQEPYVVTYGTPPDQPVATITQHWWPSADGLLALTIRVEAWHYRPDPGVGSGWTFVVAKNGHDQGESSSISFLRDIIGDTERWREATAGFAECKPGRH